MLRVKSSPECSKKPSLITRTTTTRKTTTTTTSTRARMRPTTTTAIATATTRVQLAHCQGNNRKQQNW